MNSEAINVLNRFRNASPSKKVHEGVNTLWVVLMEVPKHSIVWNIGPRVSLVAAIHGRELDGISDEEHRKVVEYKILDTLLGIKLCRPATDIANGIA